MGEDKAEKNFSKKDWSIAIGILTVVLVVIGGFVFYNFGVSHNPIPQNIRTHVSFTPYYPSKLPKDWYIDQSSYINDSKVVLYRLNSKSAGPQLSISLQPLSGSFDYDEFYKRSIKNSIKLNLPAGTAVIGVGANKMMGSLTTKDTWVIATAISSDVTQADIRQILSGLKD